MTVRNIASICNMVSISLLDVCVAVDLPAAAVCLDLVCNDVLPPPSLAPRHPVQGGCRSGMHSDFSVDVQWIRSAAPHISCSVDTVCCSLATCNLCM